MTITKPSQDQPMTSDLAPQFDNTFVRQLPGDPETVNQRRQVMGASYSLVQPTAVKAPRLIAYSQPLAEQLGFSCAFVQSDEFLQAFSGNRLLPGMKPYAMCYGGHQFGQWAGQLGDGRAINLGEIMDRNGQRQTLQLKGAGPTPYSRSADGLAVMRSSVREFLCSEAMFHLGVPTTRALSLIGTGEKVMRDMFYDGRPAYEPGAIVCRVAPSFIRFGNYEILAARKDYTLLKQLADYTIATYFTHLESAHAPTKQTYLAWFKDICRSTAHLMVEWMRVGFVHGVMNTDNMSIHGLTIDYGPYGWLEDFNPDWTPNTTDAQHRRYRFANQPAIAQWNLAQLANSIFPLIEDSEALQGMLTEFATEYTQSWHAMMLKKLGVRQTVDPAQTDTATQLVQDLQTLLPQYEIDMTLFFRALADLPCDEFKTRLNEVTTQELLAPLQACFYFTEVNAEVPLSFQNALADWLRRYVATVGAQQQSDSERRTAMNAVNPLYVLRNYLAQLAIDKAAEGDVSGISELLSVLENPYTKQPGKSHLAAKRPDWARSRAGCSMLSCSS